MTEGLGINALLKSGLYFIIIVNMCAIVFALPAIDKEVVSSDIMENKVETFKRDILKGLGYQRPPEFNFTQNIDEKRRMIEAYRKYIEDRDGLSKETDEDEEEETEEKSRITSKAFYSIEYSGGIPSSVRPDDWTVSNAFRLYFPVQPALPVRDQAPGLNIHSAQVRVFVKNVRPDNLKDTLSVDKLIRINAYQILSITNTTLYTRTLLDSKLFSLTDRGWVTFEVAKAVQSWLADNTTNLGIEIAAESQDIHSVIDMDLSSSETASNSTSNSPSVHVYATVENTLKRVKRRARRRNCRAGDGESRCCRFPIKISFEDIGWDSWIIAPREYQGYYCAGSCPYSHKMANNFAGIKALLHMQNPSVVPSPCCAATKLSPFTILHYNEHGKYVFSDYPDLVVRQCRCG